MRFWSIILLVFGVYLLGHAVYDECSGTTHQPLNMLTGMRRHSYNSGYLYRRIYRRDQQPDLFRRFMTTHWICAGVICGIGVALFISNQPSKNE